MLWGVPGYLKKSPVRVSALPVPPLHALAVLQFLFQGLADSFDFLIDLIEILDFQRKSRVWLNSRVWLIDLISLSIFQKFWVSKEMHGLVEFQGLADSFDFLIDLLEILDFQRKSRVWLNSRVWLIDLVSLSIS